MARFPRPDMVSSGEVKDGLISRHHNTSSFDGRPVVAGTTYGHEDLGMSDVATEKAGKVDMDKVKF